MRVSSFVSLSDINSKISDNQTNGRLGLVKYWVRDIEGGERKKKTLYHGIKDKLTVKIEET